VHRLERGDGLEPSTHNAVCADAAHTHEADHGANEVIAAALDDHDSVATWFSGLASVTSAVGALIRNQAGQVLLAKPTYKRDWVFVGGTVNDGEPPLSAMRRELIEELGPALGCRIRIGRLLVTDWIAPKHGWDRPMHHLVFDCGVLTEHEFRSVVIAQEELRRVSFIPLHEVSSRMAYFEAQRVEQALVAARKCAHVFLQDGVPQ